MGQGVPDTHPRQTVALGQTTRDNQVVILIDEGSCGFSAESIIGLIDDHQAVTIRCNQALDYSTR